MAALLVRNLPEETHAALKARAASHNRSTEAEVRAILTAAVHEEEPRIGTLLADLGRSVGGVELDIERDKTPYEPITFE